MSFQKAILVVLLGSFLLHTASTVRQSRASPKYTDWRLPRSLLPRQYKLRLLPYLDSNFTTTGYVEILLECMQDTGLIVLHMAEITIVKEGLQIHDLIESRRVGVQSYVEDKTRQLLVIGTKNETLRKGMFYRLSIHFVSHLNENLNGFYRASYVDGGAKKFLATTQFSPTDARRAFPCFDEPGMKARFQITIGRHKSRKSHSNMPIKQTIPHDRLPDYVWDEYETTNPMSTYVVAFIVSEFESVESHDLSPAIHNRVRFQFWARPSSLKQMEYARDLGPRVLEYFESYFNISFPLPKLDMFAIPDFAVGAMENWGLITYRETALLYDPARSSSINKQRVATVIAHELAHQWFGNLVTMEWWSDLWLKEGFASYLEYVGVDATDNSLQVGQLFTVQKMHVVFEVDALATSHPMSMPVHKRNEVNELFDSIPYAKGPSVIRMLAGFLGQTNFRKGLSLYLNNKKYQNAVQADLWAAFNNQSSSLEGQLGELPASVETIMNSWSLQAGYPIVTVRRDYENQSAILTQERFYLLPNRNASDFPLWWIPLTFTTNFNATYSAWMMGTEDGIELELTASPTEWIIFNVDQLGYYRVNYDDENWQLISNQLRDNHHFIPVLNRAQLLDDSLTVARTGELSYSVVMELMRYLRSERDYVPWKAALSGLDYLDRMLYHTPGKDKFRDFMKWLVLPAFEDVGFEQKPTDSHLTILNRNQIISWACKMGVPECIENVTALYKAWIEHPEKEGIINPNYKNTIICAAIANGGDDEWDFALERYLSTDLSTEKETLLYALGCSTNPQALNTLLEWSLEAKSGIRRQDTQTVFASVARNPLGQSMVFNFTLKNWDRIVKAFPSLYVLGRLFDSIVLSLNTEDHLKSLVDLSQGGKGDLGTATRSVNQAVEKTRINLNWMKRHSKTVTALVNSWTKQQTFASR